MTQLVELQGQLEEFESQDIRVYAISYDPQAALSAFAENHEVTYDLLSDYDSAVIKDFGILNTLIAETDPEQHPATQRGFYGVPFPGTYVVDEDGVVTEKFFLRHYGSRTSAGSILNSALGKVLIHDENPQAETSAEHVKISAFLADSDLKLESNSTLYVRLEVADGHHIYGEPLPEGFHATRIRVEDGGGLRFGHAVYPDTKPLRLKGLDVTLSVYEGVVDIAIPVTATADVANWNIAKKPDSVTIEVAVNYQVCSDSVCYAPKTERLSLKVPLVNLVTPGSGRRR